MSMSSYTAGAFTSYNSGIVGQGWGINTSTFSQTVNNKVFEITNTGGLLIDLYSLLYMNPFEKMDFLIDHQIDQNYFKVEQNNNLIFITPLSKLISDNYPDEMLFMQIYMIGANGTNLETNININYKKNNNIIPESKQIYYIDFNFEIPIINLVPYNNENDISNYLTLTHIDGKDISILGEDYNLIDGNILKLNGLGYNPELTFKYDNGSIINFLKINFINVETKFETLISNIIVVIDQVNGLLIDTKDYTNNNSDNLSVQQISFYDEKLFNINTYGQFIEILPNTREIIKLDSNNLTKQILIKFTYTTPTSKGIFDLIVNVDSTKNYKDLDTLKYLTPKAERKTITLTDGYLIGTEYIGIETLLNNRVYGSTEKPEIYITHPIENLEYVNAGGKPRLKIPTGKKIPVPSTIRLNFRYSNNINLDIDIEVVDDKVLNKEDLLVEPIDFVISSTYKNTVNIFDHIFMKASKFDTIKIKPDKPERFFNYFTYPVNQLYSVDTDLLSLYTESTTLNGFISIYTEDYTSNLNLDDYGNIIGHRKIPYTIVINKSNSNFRQIRVDNFNIYLNGLEVIEGPMYDYDRGFVNFKTTDPINVIVDPSTTISDLYLKTGTTFLAPDNTYSIFVDMYSNLALIWLNPLLRNNPKYLEVSPNTNIVFKYTQDIDGELFDYYQTINFIKKI